jgi:hypothetical protein
LAKQACESLDQYEPDQKLWALAEDRTVPPSGQDGINNLRRAIVKLHPQGERRKLLKGSNAVNFVPHK